MELVNMASVDSVMSERPLVIEYVPLEDTLHDTNIYVVHTREDGSLCQLYRELESHSIVDLAVEDFCHHKGFGDPSLIHIKRNSFKQFTQYPEPIEHIEQGSKLKRSDNCVYLLKN